VKRAEQTSTTGIFDYEDFLLSAVSYILAITGDFENKDRALAFTLTFGPNFAIMGTDYFFGYKQP